jgi:hypothetical protein
MSSLLEDLAVIIPTIWHLKKIMKTLWAKQKFHIERFNLRRLNNVELEAQYKARLSNRFVALGDLDKDVHVNRI